MNSIYKVFILVFSLIFLSCNFNSTYRNRTLDKNEAEIITNKLYEFLERDEFSNATSLFSSKFLEVTPLDSLNKMFLDVKSLGKYEGRALSNFETFVVEGSNPKSEYIFIYDVNYEKFSSQETIRLEKEGDSIKIVTYQIHSDGFN